MPSDEDIERDVVDTLYWDDRIDASDVIVEVDRGTVTLAGTVATPRQRDAAGTDARTVAGVVTVDNQIAVDETVSRPLDDDEILAEISRTLVADPDIDAGAIDVSVDAGRVELTGSVDSYWKREVVEDLISGIIGVHTIEDKLAVTPEGNFVDEQIASDVVDALDRNREVDVRDMDVEVLEGRVTLSGQVPDWRARDAAYHAARFTPGVVDVRDALTLSAPQPA